LLITLQDPRIFEVVEPLVFLPDFSGTAWFSADERVTNTTHGVRIFPVVNRLIAPTLLVVYIGFMLIGSSNYAVAQEMIAVGISAP